MTTALSKEELDNEDYYSLLNVRREASSEELKAAYRRLCMLYHSDKHRDPELKSQAEWLFNLVHQAYEVLSDPQTRAIYDIYGKKGLEMEGWEGALGSCAACGQSLNSYSVQPILPAMTRQLVTWMLCLLCHYLKVRI